MAISMDWCLIMFQHQYLVMIQVILMNSVLGDDSSNFDELVLDDGDFDSYKFDPSVFVLTADFLDLRGILADFAYITKRYGLEATTR